MACGGGLRPALLLPLTLAPSSLPNLSMGIDLETTSATAAADPGGLALTPLAGPLIPSILILCRRNRSPSFLRCFELSAVSKNCFSSLVRLRSGLLSILSISLFFSMARSLERSFLRWRLVSYNSIIWISSCVLSSGALSLMMSIRSLSFAARLRDW